MIIERIQIEEGFLDGLDVQLASGLNVIIGARGTGKSSLIELIRFCLNARSHSDDSKRKSYNHALSVLGGGRISVTIKIDEDRIIVSRSADDDKPDFNIKPSKKPLIFSQSEIEGVGLEASGRLRILDGFIKDNEKLQLDIDQTSSVIISLMTKIQILRQSIDALELEIANEIEIDKAIESLKPQEMAVSKASEEVQFRLKELNPIQDQLNKVEVYHENVNNLNVKLKDIKGNTERSLDELVNLSDFKLSNELSSINLTNQLRAFLESVLSQLESLENQSSQLISLHEETRKNLGNKARQLRSSIDDIQKGAGLILNQMQRLHQEKAKLEVVKNEAKQKRKELISLEELRNNELDKLENIRNLIFNQRLEVESRLNSVLKPEIYVEVIQAGQIDTYSSVLMSILKGSGLQYSNLAPQIASKISPRELVDFVYRFETNEVSNILEINPARASRLLSTLHDADLGLIATVPVDDSVYYSLLDGGDYKSLNELSVGQRCTLILPVLLEHTERVIILDQPEDHIDNAFIVNTLIKSICRRSDTSQMILSTHNANIPVLGNANRVIQLASDGNRGYVEVEGFLEDKEVVSSISTIMEGGAEAFENRSRFYKSIEK